jgi:hypothetical protein
MPFTNLWDDTFPPDTQLANQLGLDLRNFRLDAQQRMAAISGLDAAKPAFGADAQPANWNGILFFATDTGKIYQFANPVWVDVTGSFQISGTRKVYQNATLINHLGTTTLDTIYNFAFTPLGAGQSLRVKFVFRVNGQSAPSSEIQLFMNGTTLNLATESWGSPQLNTAIQIEVLVCASTSTIAMMLLKMDFQTGPPIIVASSVPNGGGYPDFTVKCKSGTNTDTQGFGPILAEVI